MNFDGPPKIASIVVGFLAIPLAIAAGFQGAMVGSGWLGRVFPDHAVFGGSFGFCAAFGLVECGAAAAGMGLVIFLQFLYGRVTRK